MNVIYKSVTNAIDDAIYVARLEQRQIEKIELSVYEWDQFMEEQGCCFYQPHLTFQHCGTLATSYCGVLVTREVETSFSFSF